MGRPHNPTMFEIQLHRQIALLRAFLRMSQQHAPSDLAAAINQVLATTEYPSARYLPTPIGGSEA